MHSIRTVISILLLLIYIIHSSRANTEEHQANEQALAAAHFQTLKQLLSRRSLYDPAYGDSWSNYFEKKTCFIRSSI